MPIWWDGVVAVGVPLDYVALRNGDLQFES